MDEQLPKRLKWIELCKWQDKQVEAWEAVKSHKYTLYGGAAGGGKSYFLRWLAVRRLLDFNKRGLTGVRVGLFCEDYPALMDRHLSKIPFEFPQWLGTLNKSSHEFILAEAYGSGVISFRNLDDPNKYLSSEFADIYVDELTRNPRSIFDFLIMRMRWPGIDDTKFVGATNPGSVGHGWVKKLWIDRDFRDEEHDEESFSFVKARCSDNKYLGEAYEKQLGVLPENLRKAYRDGSWDVFAGQFFTEFNREIHVIEPFKDIQSINWFNSLPSYAGMDYGYSKPSCVLWGKIHDDTWYIYRELYEINLTFEQLSSIIQEKEKPSRIYADPSIWAKKDSPISGAEKMRPLVLKPAFNDRAIGWNVLKQIMKVNKIKIFNTCTDLIRTIPIQVYDDVKVEDLDTNGEDHAVDALRYLIATHRKSVPASQIEGMVGKSGQSDIEEVFGRNNNMGDITRPIYK